MESLTTEAVIRSSQARPNNTLRMTASRFVSVSQEPIMVVPRIESPVRLIALGLIVFAFLVLSSAQDIQPLASAAKAVGTISAVNGGTIILKKDDGSELKINTQETTRYARIAPGQRDLKDAAPIQLQNLEAGDRILVRGSSSNDASITAATVLVMKKSDVEAKLQTERRDWQRRGAGGLVTSVDAGMGTVMISTIGFSGKKNIAVHTTKNTVIRRYASDSIKFDDAKLSTLDQIKPGDQLRARGNRNEDGTTLAADEIVSGSFRNIAGTVTGTDPGRNVINVTDLATKKAVMVKITGDSQVRKLTPEMAQRIAMRLKAMNGAPGQVPETVPANGVRGEAGGNIGARAGGTGQGARPGGPPDFQQMLNRLPAASIAEFQKGDAVMIVSTEGAEPVTAITLLGGVEPILAASPSGSEPMRLSPWTLAGGGGEEASQ